MNTSELTCNHCGQTVFIAAEQFGQPMPCPHCQQPIAWPAVLPAENTQRPDGMVYDPAATVEGAAPAEALVAPLPPDSATALPASAPLAPRPRRNSQLVPILLIFLIPYAVVATGVIAYLLWQQQQRRSDQHPLEMLLDQQPGDGSPRKQIKHDTQLPDKLKKQLNQPFAVEGFVEMTALRVELSPAGDQLALTLRFRNLSSDLEFNPMPQSFLTLDKGYTFLEFGQPPRTHRIYGGIITWPRTAATPRRGQEGLKGNHSTQDGMLAPGEEKIAVLSTLPDLHADGVKLIANYRGPMLWRLQIRRGLVEVRDRWVSATMVVGIEFDATAALADHIRDARLRAAPVLWASATFPLRGQRFLEKSR